MDDVESAPTVVDVKAKEKMEKEVGGNCCGGVEIPPFLGTVAKLSLITRMVGWRLHHQDV